MTSESADTGELIRRLNHLSDNRGTAEWFVAVELADGREAWVNPDFVAYVI